MKFYKFFPKFENIYKVIVVEYVKNANNFFGSGYLIIEIKFTRILDTCGHIEDIVVESLSLARGI